MNNINKRKHGVSKLGCISYDYVLIQKSEKLKKISFPVSLSVMLNVSAGEGVFIVRSIEERKLLNEELGRETGDPALSNPWLFKDTHMEKTLSNQTPALTKSMNISIWVLGTSNQPL